MQLVILIASLLVLAEPSNSAASDQPGSSCDDLGALAADTLRQSEPVKFQNIQVNQLINAWRAAITSATQPQGQARFYLQLGRGQLRDSDSRGAISSFHKSASFTYPAGYFALGVAYLLGDDVEKDDAKAKDYLLLALENNVIWAAKALSALHESKASKRSSKKRMPHSHKRRVYLKLRPGYVFEHRFILKKAAAGKAKNRGKHSGNANPL
jgi:TPR repeat protein